MAIQQAICNQCGGKLEVDDVDLNGFCQCSFCGTPHKVIDIITIDGLPTAKSLLADADLNREDGNLEASVKLYKEVLKIKPNCSEAWWGLYICNAAFDRYYNYEDKYGNSGPLTKASIMENTINKYAMHAIKYAPPELAEKFKKYIQPDLDYVDSIRNGTRNSKSRGGLVSKLKNMLNKK